MLSMHGAVSVTCLARTKNGVQVCVDATYLWYRV